ncbi:unnamed protein product, partial [Sphagnum compactum]
VLYEISEKVTEIFNDISLKSKIIYASLSEDTKKEVEDIFDYARKKIEQVYKKLNLSYKVPKVFGEQINKNILLSKSESYSVQSDLDSGNSLKSVEQIESPKSIV